MRHDIIGLVILAVFVLVLLPADSRGLSERDITAQEPVTAEQLEGTLRLALERFQQGDTAQSITLLGEAIMQIRNSLPLKISKLLMCSEIRDFNDYDARDGFVLKTGEPLLLYIEPEGYGVVKEGAAYRVWISQDVEIKDAAGDVIFQRNNWVDYQKAFTTPVIPFYLTNRITDIPAGKYAYTFTLKDHLKNTFLTQTFQFSVQ